MDLRIGRRRIVAAEVERYGVWNVLYWIWNKSIFFFLAFPYCCKRRIGWIQNCPRMRTCQNPKSFPPTCGQRKPPNAIKCHTNTVSLTKSSVQLFITQITHRPPHKSTLKCPVEPARLQTTSGKECVHFLDNDQNFLAIDMNDKRWSREDNRSVPTNSHLHATRTRWLSIPSSLLSCLWNGSWQDQPRNTMMRRIEGEVESFIVRFILSLFNIRLKNFVCILDEFFAMRVWLSTAIGVRLRRASIR